MKIIVSFVFITTIIFGCQPRNSEFNPFDSEFEFHRTMNIAVYDTIMIQCGYWNLTKRSDQLDIYYQFFVDEPQIEAKGFDYRIAEYNSFAISNKTTYDSVKQILETKTIDKANILSDLIDLGISEIEIANDSSEFTNVILKDIEGRIYFANLLTQYDEHEQRMIRQISYFNGRKN